MIEHIAAIMVMSMVCLSIAAVQHTHQQLVVPARLNALAKQAGLNMVRLNRANAATRSEVILGRQHFNARIAGSWVEVRCDASDKKWRFSTSVHDD
ncbi:hypothetical protein PQ472_08040 [Lacticaseibacillus pabuli]|uniref:Prepilin-type N-terminal cleavage/methylation domain-containing protein n=1 Tax=Lacticaseibacillus pabuli TaxID=3025672 RepID=A0ABY7WRX9_9LACO|nr:hypothetical protein [Lacticaseibacillus sp. KACC 23028]WDF81875.1 hypothetical protein PQ472_08040 [Lacticaseibacillus sp. KACC 23028]